MQVATTYKIEDRFMPAALHGRPVGMRKMHYLQDNRPESLVQRRNATGLAQKQVEAIPANGKTNATGLPNRLKSGIESLSGYAMDDVKVHFNSQKPAQLHAHAYAQGHEIHLAPGQEKHLPHEAWHIVQQKQGRVQPTLPFKGGIAINDNLGLEHEADVMGAKAMQTPHTAAVGTRTVSAKGDTIQAKFVALNEAQIRAVQDMARENGEELEAEYLQGLYVRQAELPDVEMHPVDQQEAEDDQAQMEVDVPEHEENQVVQLPQFFIQVCNLVRSFFTGNREHTNVIKLFAGEQATEQAENGQIMEVIFYDVNERGITLPEIVANADRILPGEGPRLAENIRGALLLGGVAQPDNNGYGSIEFRFRNVQGGRLYTTHPEQYQGNPFNGFDIRQTSPAQMNDLKQRYIQAGFPYSQVRAGDNCLVIEQSLVPAFDRALDNPGYSRNPQGAMERPDDMELAPPIVVPKVRTKNYEFRATRGSRGAGQKAAMGNYSALDYVLHFTDSAQTDWEWLHIQGSRLGGPNRPENLVAGTFDANTHMIPYERAIFEMSTMASQQHPVQVRWVAVVRTIDGENTHIGDTIRIEVSLPNGTDNADLQRMRNALFTQPVMIRASDPAAFTKADRDEIERRKNQQ